MEESGALAAEQAQGWSRPGREPTAPSCCPGTGAAAAKPRSPHGAEAGYQVKSSPHTACNEISFNASKAYAGWCSLVPSVPPFPPLEHTVHKVYGAATD